MRQVFIDVIKADGTRIKRHTVYFHSPCLLSKPERKADAMAQVKARFGPRHPVGTTYKVALQG